MTALLALVAIVFVPGAEARRAVHLRPASHVAVLTAHAAPGGRYDLTLRLYGSRRGAQQVVVRTAAGMRVAHVGRRGANLHIRLRVRTRVIRVWMQGRSFTPRAKLVLHPVATQAGAQKDVVKSTTSTSATTSTTSTTSTSPIAIGAYVSGVPEYPSLLDTFSNQIGRRPAIVLWYRYWTEPLFNTHDLSAVASRGAAPLVTWEPWSSDGTGVPLSAIADGQEDTTIRAAAAAAASWGKPILVRFAQEMNGHWFPWGLGQNGNTAAIFIAAWRHIVDVFRATGATNVRWVWTPNEMDSSTPDFRPLYPGDAYVDWVGIDGYNFGTNQGNVWQSFTSVFGESYAAMTGLTNKPLMIAETASVEQGGSKADWITSALNTEIPKSFPKVRALVWFDKTYNGGLDWPIDSSSSALSAFKSAVNSPRYSLSGSSLLAIPTS